MSKIITENLDIVEVDTEILTDIGRNGKKDRGSHIKRRG